MRWHKTFSEFVEIWLVAWGFISPYFGRIQRVMHLIFMCPCIVSVIFYLRPTRCNYFWFIYFLKALHVSGGSSAHRREHITVHTASGIVNQYCCKLVSWMRWNTLFFIYLFLKGSTCFRRFLRPSSGAHNCTHSFRYCQLILLQAGIMDEMELAQLHLIHDTSFAAPSISTVSHKRHDFRKKERKKLPNTKCVLISSTTFVGNISHSKNN